MTQSSALKVVSLKQSKAATVAPSNEVVTLAPAEALKLAGVVGNGAMTQEQSKLDIADACKRLRAANVKLGKTKATTKVKACPIIAAYLKARFPTNIKRNGQPVTDDDRSKYASYFRAAVESGKPYSEGNANKAAKGGNIMIAFPKAASGVEAASKLMAGFNKMKEANTELAKLAGYLIDAIGNAGFDPATCAADAEIDAE